MTLGEKIKTARQSAGLTQEQLAEKLMVSRPAVTKWECDKGIPDIDNLKAIAKLLQISLDDLLGNDEALPAHALREPIDLSVYGKGMKAKDRAVRARYPTAAIRMLSVDQPMTKKEYVLDFLFGFLFDIPAISTHRVVQLWGKSYGFLVTDERGQWLVTFDKDCIETRRLPTHIEAHRGAKFRFKGLLYTDIGELRKNSKPQK